MNPGCQSDIPPLPRHLLIVDQLESCGQLFPSFSDKQDFSNIRNFERRILLLLLLKENRTSATDVQSINEPNRPVNKKKGPSLSCRMHANFPSRPCVEAARADVRVYRINQSAK